MKRKNDVILTFFIIFVVSLMIGSVVTQKEHSFGGKARDVNMKLLEKRIIEKSLSDKEADFYEKVK